VHLARLSLTVLKGAGHEKPSSLALDENGPRHDRRFCWVDLAAGRVLRTVENPALLACRASFNGTCLLVRWPDGSEVTGIPHRSAAAVVDYWGRDAHLAVVEGPWAAAMSTYLGRDVVLAQVQAAGQVVFGGRVTVLTTSSLRELARRTGRDLDEPSLLVDSERFRSTMVVDSGDAPPFVEDTWWRMVVGSAVLRVRGAVPRCAVVRLEPGVGRLEQLDPLRALAADRTEVNLRGREVVFGIDAEVEVAGLVSVGDEVQPS